MGSKFLDTTSIMQVIGCVYNNPSLLEQTDKYVITDEDFPDKFHKIVFGAIYNIYNLGASKINLKNILDFLAQHPKSEAVFKKEKGEEWLVQIAENASKLTADFKNAHKEISWSSINGLRNRIVHDYGHTDETIVLDTLENDIPKLGEILESSI
jgi:uncharacterized protein with HEPN domain